MNNHMHSTNAAYIEARQRLAATNLKRCPLCDSLNAAANSECFVCRWHGQFLQDQKSIEEGLADLLNKCPEYQEKPVRKPRSKVSRLSNLMRRMLYGPVDFRV